MKNKTFMENKHEGCIKGYHRSSKAWYAASIKERINVTFGMYSLDGGTSGEMTMEWQLLDNVLCAQLRCFEDAWEVLGMFTDVIAKLAQVDGQEIQEEAFVKILDECGFKDLTAYQRQ